MTLNTYSEGQGHPIVFLHGLFGSWENWGSQMRRLSANYRVIGIDLTNHGRSPHTNQMNYNSMANDVQLTLQEMGIDRCTILGHSMGGKVAMQIATQQTASSQPQLERLIVVDIAPRQYAPHHEAIFAALNNLDLSSLRSRKDADDQLKLMISDDAVRPFLLKNLTRSTDKSFKWKMNLKILSEHYTDLLAAPERHSTSQLPAFFIKGSDSAYIQSNDFPLIDDWFSDWQLGEIPGAGHWPHSTHPDIVFTMINKFLQ